MAGNSVKLEFAGDASKLEKAAQRSSSAVEDVGKSVKSAADDFNAGAKESQGFTDKIGKLGAGVSGMTDAVDSAGSAVQALADFQRAGAERASKMARANLDVAQAQEDYNQALRDGKQAAIDSDQAEVDLEQARLDQKTALQDYNAAVKEHGKNSVEARQAQIDLKQAGVDVKQAQEDAAQATRDAAQSAIDAKGATLDLADAQREAKPPDMQKWADQIGMVTPILSGLIGVTGLVTAAQWAWNAAQAASPLTWIVLAIAAVIAVIVVIATKTDWFQRLWKVAWGGIRTAAAAVGSWFKDTLWGKWIKGAWDGIMHAGQRVWDWMKELPKKLKGAFAGIADFLFAPFRKAFNAVADAWNSTIGKLHWSVPGWVPGIGGNSIGAPSLPHFHQGGTVPGIPGQEVLTVLQAGEGVTSRAGMAGGDAGGGWVSIRGDAVIDDLVRAIAQRVDAKGGRAAQLGIRFT